MASKKSSSVVATLPYERSIVWERGERERFQKHGFLSEDFFEWVPKEEVDKYRVNAAKITKAQWQKEVFSQSGYYAFIGVAYGPKELSQTYLETWVKEWGAKSFMGGMHEAIARHELDIFDSVVLPQMRGHIEKKNAIESIQPIDAPELAPILAGVAHLKKLKPNAEAWLLRHPKAAATGLIPDATSKDAKKKKAAINAIKLLAKNGKAADVAKIAKAYGEDVAKVIDRLIAK